jgi:hypothetical protein
MHEKDFTLLRILKGRLVYRRGDLLLFIHEPSQDLMFESIEIYQDIYDKIYEKGGYLKEELDNLLIELNLINPHDENEIDKLKKDIDGLKVQAYKSYHKTKDLQRIKKLIRLTESIMVKLSLNRSKWDHYSCEGSASYARWSWLIENSVYNKDGSRFNWDTVDVNTIMQYYERNSISTSEFRYIARNDPWRSMWNVGKKQNNIFDKPSTQLTRDQIFLSSFSSMYDNVMEHPESPPEGIINDDDCLDGWFIEQRKKQEQNKKEQSSNNILQNSKIANSKEIYIVADSPEEIENINSMNSMNSKIIKRDRENTIADKKFINSDLHFEDVKRELQERGMESFTNKMRGK